MQAAVSRPSMEAEPEVGWSMPVGGGLVGWLGGWLSGCVGGRVGG